MEAGAVLLLLFALSGTSSTLSFYGDSISFVAPRKTKDETFTVQYLKALHTFHKHVDLSGLYQTEDQNKSLHRYLHGYFTVCEV